jgi:hypothetical protein
MTITVLLVLICVGVSLYFMKKSSDKDIERDEVVFTPEEEIVVKEDVVKEEEVVGKTKRKPRSKKK